jgi:hypothetical protein
MDILSKREHGKAMTEICVDWEITIWLFNIAMENHHF